MTQAAREQRPAAVWTRWAIVGACSVPITAATVLALFRVASLFVGPSSLVARERTCSLANQFARVRPGYTEADVLRAVGRPDKSYSPNDGGRKFPLPDYTWDGWKPVGTVWVYSRDRPGPRVYVYFGREARVHHVWIAQGPFT